MRRKERRECWWTCRYFGALELHAIATANDDDEKRASLGAIRDRKSYVANSRNVRRNNFSFSEAKQNKTEESSESSYEDSSNGNKISVKIFLESGNVFLRIHVPMNFCSTRDSPLFMFQQIVFWKIRRIFLENSNFDLPVDRITFYHDSWKSFTS